MRIWLADEQSGLELTLPTSGEVAEALIRCFERTDERHGGAHRSAERVEDLGVLIDATLRAYLDLPQRGRHPEAISTFGDAFGNIYRMLPRGGVEFLGNAGKPAPTSVGE